ncbi:MAG: histidine--tRNA ligase [Bacteroidales bacterium]
MAKVKPSIPKGTRDFAPATMVKREYIFDTIKKVFKKYGFQPLETPSMENISTLTGKYGEEGDKLLFRILNSGDYLSKATEDDLLSRDLKVLTPKISNKGLRYDLTVPFARFVVQHRGEITFPFKRYQIQPVWRADKPQKGRYREFYQCDVDVIGSDSLINEVELIKIIDEVFTALNLKVTIKINNRKVLKGLADYLESSDKFTDITIAVDKLDKIGIEGVKEDLKKRGINESAVEKIDSFLRLEDNNLSETKKSLQEIFSGIPAGEKGIEETEEIFNFLESVELKNEVEFDPKLARGLDYYTGTIFEVKAREIEIGSICGGGRYDDLTGVFGLNDVSGVGISFGAERIFDVMEKLDKFPEGMQSLSKILFVNFGKEEVKHTLKYIQVLRDNDIPAVLYPDTAKMKKQFSYADNLNIKYVAIVGQDEIKNDRITLKNMETGEQSNLTLDELINKLSY